MFESFSLQGYFQITAEKHIFGKAIWFELSKQRVFSVV